MKENTMACTLEDVDELEEFTLDLMGGGVGHFRGIEVRCSHQLGLRKWIVFSSPTTSFTADIGPDDMDYTVMKLVQAGLLDTPKG